MLLVLAAIYGILYLILQLEDYALLAGAILGFLALTIVMFVTLRVDWSGSGAGGGDRPAPQPGEATGPAGDAPARTAPARDAPARDAMGGALDFAGLP
jgi:hypothetical protein